MYASSRLLIAALLIAMTEVTTAGAQSAEEMNKTLDDLYGAHAPYHRFFEKLKKAVAESDKETVASMVEYPFQARIDGKAMKIRDTAHFVADYDKVISAKVKQAVVKQTYPALFANWQGVMIGDGEIWFSGIDDNNTVKIIAING